MALTDGGFAHSPAVGGWLAYRTARSEPAALGILQAFVPNEGDVWELTLDAVGAYFERAATQSTPPEPTPTSIADVIAAAERSCPTRRPRRSGRISTSPGCSACERPSCTARSRHAPIKPAFAPEPFTALYQRSVFQTMRNHATATFTTAPQAARRRCPRKLGRRPRRRSSCPTTCSPECAT